MFLANDAYCTRPKKRIEHPVAWFASCQNAWLDQPWGKRGKVCFRKCLGIHGPDASAIPPAGTVVLNDDFVIVIVLLGLGQQENVLVGALADPSRSRASHWACTTRCRSVDTSHLAVTRRQVSMGFQEDPSVSVPRACRDEYPSREPGSSCPLHANVGCHLCNHHRYSTTTCHLPSKSVSLA